MFLPSARRVELEVHCDDDRWVTFNQPQVGTGFKVICGFCRLRLSWFTMKFSAETFAPYGWFPPWSGYSEFEVSSRQFCCSICDWENEFTIFLADQYYFRVDSSRIHIWCIQLFKIFQVCHQNISFPNPPRSVQSHATAIRSFCFFIGRGPHLCAIALVQAVPHVDPHCLVPSRFQIFARYAHHQVHAILGLRSSVCVCARWSFHRRLWAAVVVASLVGCGGRPPRSCMDQWHRPRANWTEVEVVVQTLVDRLKIQHASHVNWVRQRWNRSTRRLRPPSSVLPDCLLSQMPSRMIFNHCSKTYWSKSSFPVLPAMPPSEFPTFPCFCNGFLILSICRIDEINASQFSSVIELWFFNSPFLLLLLWAAFDTPDKTSGHKQSGLVVAWIFVHRSPERIFPLGVHSLNNVNFGNTVHESAKFRYSSTFQWLSIRLYCNKYKFVCVVLVTSMYFTGTGFCVILCFVYLRVSLQFFFEILLSPPYSGFSDSMISFKQFCCSICDREQKMFTTFGRWWVQPESWYSLTVSCRQKGKKGKSASAKCRCAAHPKCSVWHGARWCELIWTKHNASSWTWAQQDVKRVTAVCKRKNVSARIVYCLHHPSVTGLFPLSENLTSRTKKKTMLLSSWRVPIPCCPPAVGRSTPGWWRRRTHCCVPLEFLVGSLSNVFLRMNNSCVTTFCSCCILLVQLVASLLCFLVVVSLM